MRTRFTFNGSLSDEIAVDNGVKQDDISALSPFSAYFALVLMYANCNSKVYLELRTAGKVFDLKGFNFKFKTFRKLIIELLYADDADFIAHSQDDLQHIMDRFSKVCDAFGLTIRLEKTKMMFTPAPVEVHQT